MIAVSGRLSRRASAARAGRQTRRRTAVNPLGQHRELRRSQHDRASGRMKTRAPVDLNGGADDMNSAANRALLAERQLWRAAVDEDGHYSFAVPL